MPRDPYEVLGIARDADGAAILAAYRRAALREHPDKNPGDEQGAQVRFCEATAAYQLLSDPEKRVRFDRFGYEPAAGGVSAGVPPNFIDAANFYAPLAVDAWGVACDAYAQVRAGGPVLEQVFRVGRAAVQEGSTPDGQRRVLSGLAQVGEGLRVAREGFRQAFAGRGGT